LIPGLTETGRIGEPSERDPFRPGFLFVAAQRRSPVEL